MVSVQSAPSAAKTRPRKRSSAVRWSKTVLNTQSVLPPIRQKNNAAPALASITALMLSPLYSVPAVVNAPVPRLSAVPYTFDWSLAVTVSGAGVTASDPVVTMR